MSTSMAVSSSPRCGASTKRSANSSASSRRTTTSSSSRRALAIIGKKSTWRRTERRVKAFDFVKAKAEGGVDYVQTADLYDGSKQTQLYSGLGGQALNAKEKEFPTIAQVLAKIPKECFERSTAKSLMYADFTAITLSVGLVAWATLPFTAYYLPAWIAYAYVAGQRRLGVGLPRTSVGTERAG